MTGPTAVQAYLSGEPVAYPIHGNGNPFLCMSCGQPITVRLDAWVHIATNTAACNPPKETPVPEPSGVLAGRMTPVELGRLEGMYQRATNLRVNGAPLTDLEANMLVVWPHIQWQAQRYDALAAQWSEVQGALAGATSELASARTEIDALVEENAAMRLELIELRRKHDRPEDSLYGEVRVNPRDGETAVRRDTTRDKRGDSGIQWMVLHGERSGWRLDDDEVRGWDVTLPVPGTPAAEQQGVTA